MSGGAKKVLYVRLPCWKIYPGGVVYVADYVHKQRPNVNQEILDLALVEKSQYKQVLEERLLDMKPDIVAFSWRNMQTFGPHPESDALDVVMQYDYSKKLWPKIVAAGKAISIIYDYAAGRLANFAFMRMVRKLLPDTRIVVGGTAVSIFAEYIVNQCPTDSVVVVGEGEDAMLSIVDGNSKPEGEHWYKDKSGKVEKRERDTLFALDTTTAVDFKYINKIFPQFNEYLDDYIGVQTKRGCPYKCHFCIYNSIEGCRQRYRSPQSVGNEIEILNKEYGVQKIWFTDAQFCSTLRSSRYVESVLDEMHARKTSVQWSGYLRFNHINQAIADKMFATGLRSIDTTFAGTQNIIDKMTLGYSLEQQMDVFRMFKNAGHTDQKVKLYMPLNAPGETCKTLMQTINRIEELYAMFGREHVLPFIFFIGIQPGTPVESLLKQEGYLKSNYNPLTLNPFTIKKLLYNPEPLGSLIGQSYLDAIKVVDKSSDYVGRATMSLLKKRLQAQGSLSACKNEQQGNMPLVTDYATKSS